MYIYYFHLLFLPLLVYVGLMKNKSPDWTYSLLLGVGVLGILYHFFKILSVELQPKEKRDQLRKQHANHEHHDHGH
uniref:Uncharacterized protein n=1 Tax=viral metagenome TaxID=1070528 RepID=A0A6C0FC78_9ZZZZ